jgi:hypothetical protein
VKRAGTRRSNGNASPLRAPLCPAGHLPLKGGDHAGRFVEAYSSTSAIGEGRHGSQSPPLRGRCPAGQRGARRGETSPFEWQSSPSPRPNPVSSGHCQRTGKRSAKPCLPYGVYRAGTGAAHACPLQQLRTSILKVCPPTEAPAALRRLGGSKHAWAGWAGFNLPQKTWTPHRITVYAVGPPPRIRSMTRVSARAVR